MNIRPEITQAICFSEHLALKAYQDCSPKRIWTIGYGHTKGVKEGDTCTPEQALQWLKEDLAETCRLVTHALSLIKKTVNDWQFTALVSLTYNIGYGNLLKSDVMKFIELGDLGAAANAFLELDHSEGVEIAGLSHRRAREREMFLTEVA